MRRIEELAELIGRNAPIDGIHQTVIPQVTLIRSTVVTTPMPAVYVPSLCLVAQGAKEAQLGNRRFRYDSSTYLFGAVDLPVTGAVTQASADAPYLCLTLVLDIAALADMVADHAADDAADVPAGNGPTPALLFGETTPALVDAAARLLALLDSPEDLPILAPLVERELLWRLLRGPAAPLLRQMASAGSQTDHIHRATRWLRDHLAEPVTIDQLATMAGMSPSAFHQHFKTVTGLSPLQYRSQLRVREARRMMMVEGLDAATAGFRVGYGSPSQFSREYGRLLGLPPGRDLERLRTESQRVAA